MSQRLMDRTRRTLLVATSALGIAGLGMVAVPFVRSMSPSARARAAGGPVEVDVSKLEVGQMLTVGWRGRPIWILRRDAVMLDSLGTLADQLADPESKVESQQPAYARNAYRSIEPEILVAIGLCTHLGCVPLARLEPGGVSGLGAAWPGGYFCPCHGSKFDLAGRVYKNLPAPTNLVVPPHRYKRRGVIEIGVNAGLT